MLPDQPWRWSGGRSAEDDTQSLAGKTVDCAVEPFPAPLFGRRFNPRPREFADPSPGQSQISHARRIEIPAILRPLFGVIANAERERIGQECPGQSFHSFVIRHRIVMTASV